MTDEKIQELWTKATNWDIAGYSRTMDDLREYTKVVLADERERTKWDGIHTCSEQCDKPACVAARAAARAATRVEREKVAEWMIRQGYATGHGETTEDLLAELEWQIAENWGHALAKGVEGERSQAADLVEQMSIEGYGTLAIAAAIRARGRND